MFQLFVVTLQRWLCTEGARAEILKEPAQHEILQLFVVTLKRWLCAKGARAELLKEPAQLEMLQLFVVMLKDGFKRKVLELSF